MQVPSRRERRLVMLSAFANPQMFRGGGFPAVIGEDGVLVAEGTRFRFADTPDIVEAGTEVRVYVGRAFFYAVVAADQQAYDTALSAYRAAMAAEEAAAADARRAATEAFNSALALPFSWVPGHRVVLSGLLANSWGNGTNRRTVCHVMLKEPYTRGRLKRQAGQFLCSAHVDAYGSDEGMREWPDGRVSCGACLKAAERLKA